MDFVELSIESLREESRRLAALVEINWKPDAVVYLAKGGYLIGLEVADYFGADLLEISAHRSGDSTKERTSNILAKLPFFIRHGLREFEIRHRLKADSGKTQNKTMYITDRYLLKKTPKNILIVDDSADTGNSLKSARELLLCKYPESNIKIAVFNCFDAAKKNVQIDWYLLRNCLVGTPASKDNSEYQLFIDFYTRSLRN